MFIDSEFVKLPASKERFSRCTSSEPPVSSARTARPTLRQPATIPTRHNRIVVVGRLMTQALLRFTGVLTRGDTIKCRREQHIPDSVLMLPCLISKFHVPRIQIWPRTDRVMRWLHLYTGQFLTPWMIVYAASAFCLNHDKWVHTYLSTAPPK